MLRLGKMPNASPGFAATAGSDTMPAMLHIDRAYPGGNVRVDRIEGDTLYVRPDVSGHETWWFYFNFRIWNAAGRRVKVIFGDTDQAGPLTVKGPCARFDGGPWDWAGCAEDWRSFEIDVPAGVRVVQCATAVPYLHEDFYRFIADRPDIAVRAIGTTEAGRPVLWASLTAPRRRHTCVLMARSHACESMASFVLEGAVDAWRTATGELADARREAIDLHIIPFVDPDGVEQGLQGKNRSPHDHNRDWLDSPHYASIRALQRWMLEHVDAETIVFDMHCPWIRGGRNDAFFFCGLHEPMSTQLRAVQQHMPREAGDGLPYNPADDIAMDTEWLRSTSPTSHRWISAHTPVRLATSIETPYAFARGVTVTPDRCRAQGRRLADAMARALLGR